MVWLSEKDLAQLSKETEELYNCEQKLEEIKKHIQCFPTKIKSWYPETGGFYLHREVDEWVSELKSIISKKEEMEE